MARKLYPSERKIDVLIHPPAISPLPAYPKPSATSSFAREPTSSSDGKISTTMLLLIVILAIIFFLCGILHLLVRFLMKRPAFTLFSRYQSNPDSSGSVAIQRQLQQLFRLHDSGLDQAIIDALPVFFYKDIVGSKEPFDCAVCLCEFSDQDSLRLLPDCSHAFHVNCIDTWLLSNSTCPLCRGTLVCAGSSFDNQLFSLDYFMELSNTQQNEGGSGRFTNQKPTIMEEPAGERRVYSVRLGKFRSVCNEGVVVESNQRDHGEISSSNLDARRCYSLGSCQYVIAESDLLVSLNEGSEAEIDEKLKLDNTEVEAKRISNSNKGESFSVSKIWQWSKKGKFSSSSDANLKSCGTFHSGLSLNNGKPA